MRRRRRNAALPPSYLKASNHRLEVLTQHQQVATIKALTENWDALGKAHKELQLELQQAQATSYKQSRELESLQAAQKTQEHAVSALKAAYAQATGKAFDVDGEDMASNSGQRSTTAASSASGFDVVSGLD